MGHETQNIPSTYPEIRDSSDMNIRTSSREPKKARHFSWGDVSKEKHLNLPFSETRAKPDMLEGGGRKKSGWGLLTSCLIAIALAGVTFGSGIGSPFYNPFEGYTARDGVTLASRVSEDSASAAAFDRSQVNFDNYSLILRGQRVFLHSGEFHTFRLPVPSLWPDIVQKAKAAGLNALSVYTHMGLINPAPGVVDFDGFRALQPLFDAAKENGIFIVLRPGPYINAETTAGGIAHWATSEVAGHLRSSASDWKEAWTPYIQGIINVTAPNQLSRGGPVIAIQIDNEVASQSTYATYFQDLEAAYHAADIDVPLTYNDPGQRSIFINGTGAVDLYGLDAYPQGFDCSNPLVWKNVTTNYQQYHAKVNPSQAWYIPEFQGGAFDAWGPTAPGYPSCRTLTGPDFENVFYLQLWASNAKLISYYMLYGGTSWGGIPFHGVYTSYDYGSAITESRELTTKYDELKRQGLFLRSSPEFYKTDWVADSGSGLAVASTSKAFITYLRNPDTGAGFYVARQNDSTSTNTLNFNLTVQTSAGSLNIPSVASTITLSGRQSKVIVTDYAFGTSRLLYSTAPVLFAGVIDGRDVLLFYGDATQEHEVSLPLTGTPNNVKAAHNSKVKYTTADTGLLANQTVVNVLNGTQGLVTIWDSDKQLVMFADTTTAGTFWSPTIAGQSSDVQNYWGLGTNSSILIAGPYLVRSASISGTTLALTGDLKDDVRLTLIAPRNIRSITWNGQGISSDARVSSEVTAIGGFVAQLRKKKSLVSITIPPLTGWKYKDSLPEIQSTFDDSTWTVANKTTTNIPLKPYYGDGRILYGCDYGFCENTVLWRGHFNATGAEKSLNLSINGGEAFAASVWLNNAFLKTSFGNSTNNRNIREETDDLFTFPSGALKAGQDNVITIVQDNMGLNETSGNNPDSSKSPRGVRGFKLDVGNFTTWKVQGKVGGYKNFPDKTRGVLNEGGLFGERKGWHLPGFDTTGWTSRDLSLGLPSSSAGVGFFVTTFKLDIPKGLDVPLYFNFTEPLGQPYRAFLFVNGWMMGKRVANLGPQAKFPVHEGILNHSGVNTVAVALWSMTPGVTVAPKLQLAVDSLYDGGVGRVVTTNPSWSSAGRT